MQQRPIPNSLLSVSTLCIGTMTYGTPVPEAEAIALTHWALDHGINFIDTANMYEGYARRIGSAGGVAEEILGKALRGRRDQAVVATKVGMKIGPTDADEGLSRTHILREIDRSLKRLQCEAVDLYYMHKPYPSVPLAESIRAMHDLVDAGKIRYWAVSNFSTVELMELLAVCDANHWRRPVAIQPAYSLLKRDIEATLLPLCVKEAIAVVPYQVLLGGVLTGKYHADAPAPAGSRALEKPEWTPKLDESLFTQIAVIEQEAAAHGRTLFQHALRGPLERPGVVSLILGVKRQQQLEDALAAIG